MKMLLIVATLFASNSWANGPCGLNGTVDQRIAQCNESAGQGEFQLVTRTKKGQEIYKGLRTGVIWSADLAKPLNYFYDGVNTICNKQLPEFGGLQLNWKLPSVHRYIQALKYDIQSSIPGIAERDYWTSTADSFYVNSRYVFEGSKAYKQNWSGKYSFRHLEIEDGHAYVKCIVETIE